MQEELVKAFLEPSISLKPALELLSPYKVPNDLYSALFRSPKEEEELTTPDNNNCPLVINPELCKALEAPYESSMAT